MPLNDLYLAIQGHFESSIILLILLISPTILANLIHIKLS
ncbi:hypothetical protein HMPREF0495_02275 [Levilactobacillus brevis ATCC 14869 = DSM 20054]|uniref:Uncharacterized protein n=1 Tax=Levilactobacillus brevis ATCC 14869 = DSM 20054 TaxID=649758 RepID=U2NTK0_LEVBR|nr:hypothetical protein HMPREF0495_02275 [Levilactobacillus brevis ATCC 14869 = DSM 20054]KIO98100.1 hypothetical protein QP38_0789 [Levilactobacillus brevis]